jgi:selenocysteine lyase/cysteine desulfurase
MRFIRVGYIRAILLVDAAIVALLIADGVRLRYHGVSLLAAYRNASLLGTPSLQIFLKITAFMLFVVPGTLALLRLTLGRGSRVHGSFAMEISRIPISIHIAATALCAISGTIVPAAVRLSGLQWQSSGTVETFYPVYRLYTNAAASTLVLLGSVVVTVLVAPSIAYLSREGKPSPHVVDIVSRLYLLDLHGDLYPAGYSPRRANFMGGAISPGIRLAVRDAADLVQRYNRQGPGSPEATETLVKMANNCVDIIRRRIVHANDGATLHVGFTSNTTRALEVAMMLAAPVGAVVLSPFEHPSEEKVSAWLQRCIGVDVEQADRTRDLFVRPADEVLDDVVLATAAAVEKTRHGRVAVLVSDVCWATGTRIPVAKLIEVLAPMCPNHELVFIVDGAHAAGNNHVIEVPAACDSYVFSGHKWLFSNEPVGILVSRRPWAPPYPVDVWVPQGDSMLPSVGTAGPFKLAHLTAVLRMFEKHGIDTFWQRSRELRQRFVAALPEQCMIVGWTPGSDAAQHTFIVTVAPKQGHNWYTSSLPELETFFTQNGLSLNVVRLPGFAAAVRVTFPYFLPVRDMEKLADALRKATSARP